MWGSSKVLASFLLIFEIMPLIDADPTINISYYNIIFLRSLYITKDVVSKTDDTFRPMISLRNTLKYFE